MKYIFRCKSILSSLVHPTIIYDVKLEQIREDTEEDNVDSLRIIVKNGELKFGIGEKYTLTIEKVERK